MSDPLLLRIDVEHGTGTTTVVSVVGELDFGTTAQLIDVVEPLTAAGRTVILDLSEMEFCDSSALGALVRLHRTAVAAGGSIALARLRPQVAAIITVTSLHRLFPIHDDIPGDARPSDVVPTATDGDRTQ